jgi:quinol monooxygenase YgiN
MLPEHDSRGGAQIMSVLVILKFQGDVAKFQQAMTDHGDQFAKMAEHARTSGGGIHHRFGVGDGYVVVVDEWESVEHFEKFFANPDLQALIAASGAAPAPPEITIAQAISSPDEY